MPAETDRRRLLQLASAGAAMWWLPRSVRGQVRVGADPFTLGVASGSPTHDSVVLWTRLATKGLFGVGSSFGADAVTVRWEVAHDERFGRLVAQGQAPARPELAHSVHVEVAGLEPDRWYYYRFMVGDAVSPIGRTRTFAPPGAAVAQLRLGYASCQRWEHGYFSAYRHLREERLDALLFLGDYIYEYPNSARAVRRPSGGRVLTLDDYRARYALYKADSDLQAMHAQCPWLVTWDDHEVQNDYAGLQTGESGPSHPSSASGFGAHRAGAYQAFYEHMPLRASALTQALDGLARGAEMRVYSRMVHGRLASLYLLDTRQYRDPQVCNPEGKPGSSRVDPSRCPEWADAGRSLLGVAQESWLERQFAASAGSTWNVVGQQTLFGQRDFHAGAGQRFWNDGWDGYAQSRRRLTDAVARHGLPNLVLLGGDMHENWVGHVKADYADPASASLGVEFCGTSISSRSSDTRNVDQLLAENPHFVFADTVRKGYGVAEFTPDKLRTTLRVVDDVTRQDTRIETLASFQVRSGQARIEQV